MKLSIVLPAYNEEPNVGILTERFYKVLRKIKMKFEIIYIIQGTDGAFEKLKKLKDSGKKELRLYHYNDPLGIGCAFKEGFSKVSDDTTHVCTMDVDLNHSPEDLPRFFQKMEKTNADIVIGSRKIKGGQLKGQPFIKRLISDFANKLLPFMYRVKVRDMTSGYRLFKSKVIYDIKDEISSRNFEVYPEMLIFAKKHKYKMVEIPIVYLTRVYGKSKLRFLNSGLGYIRLLLRKYR